MGPTHNNQNGQGGPKKGGSVKITTPVSLVMSYNLELQMSLKQC